MTLLQKYLHSHALKSPSKYDEWQAISYEELACSSDFDHLSDLALLTQAGYLTIKRRQGRTIYVGYPDQEVADSMAELYSNMLLRGKTLETVGAGALESAPKSGNVSGLFTAANHAFSAIDYARHPIANEKHCQAFLRIFIAGADYDATAERLSAGGRSDLELDAGGCHWVIELKFQRRGESAGRLLEEAARQLRSRNYGAASSRRLARAAAVFSEEERAFVRWQEA